MNTLSHSEKAVAYFAKEMHCSQSILAAFADECKITEAQAFKLGSCFGAGMRKGNVCGAVTGALMVLGLLYGEEEIGDFDARARTNKLNDLMIDTFNQRYGSCLCNQLLKCDISTEEGKQKARDDKLFTEFCPKMVAGAVEILEEIIKEYSEHKE